MDRQLDYSHTNVCEHVQIYIQYHFDLAWFDGIPVFFFKSNFNLKFELLNYNFLILMIGSKEDTSTQPLQTLRSITFRL